MPGDDDAVEISEEAPLQYEKLTAAFQVSAVQNLVGTWEEDAKWRLLMRKVFAIAFSIFLLLQNIFVYWFVYYAYFYSIEGVTFAGIQPVLSVLIVGTIGQTVLIIKIMVAWIFSEVQYSSHPFVNHGNSKK